MSTELLISSEEALEYAYAATRKIMRTKSIEQLQDIIFALCDSLQITYSSDTQENTLNTIPLDLALGDYGPILPVSDTVEKQTFIIKYLVPAMSDAKYIVQRIDSSEQLVSDATHDPLTRLWNRRSLEMAIVNMKNGDSIALIDLDDFKKINDNNGHGYGDYILKLFSKFLQDSIRPDDIVGRLGGEEFVIILPKTELQHAYDVINRICHQWLQHNTQQITFSAGVANTVAQQNTEETLGKTALALADRRMYQAKNNGKNQVV